MICAEFERTKEGWKVDAEWRGYGNADMIEAFKMENIDIIGVLENMKVSETKVYNMDGGTVAELLNVVLNLKL